MNIYKRSLWFSLAVMLFIVAVLVFGMNLSNEQNTDVENNYIEECLSHPASCLMPSGGFESLRNM